MRFPSRPTCDWCKATDVHVVDARDYEEGTHGPVYSVCANCKDKQEKRLSAELAAYDDYDDRDDYCGHCGNTGELDCYCGGDLCVCENNGTYPCPYCQT